MFKRLVPAIVLLMLSCVNHDLAPKKFDCTKTTLTLALDSVSAATACGVADGAIYVSALGGIEPYSFRVNDQPSSTSNTLGGLLSGIYTVAVVDKNGCEKTLENIKVMAGGFEFTATTTDDSECINYNGSISVDVQSGNAPFQFKLGTNPFSDNNVFTDLEAGSYDLAIRDTNNCTVQLRVTVSKGNTGTSWSADILPIIQSSCAVSGCHNGISRTDYRIYANA
ncbi:MAG TPA: hypothetical protein VIM65_16885, partial [Cyclobacteriaceae bacterium]